jgi:hypothetical protein
MSLSPIEKILLAREYRVPAWLREGATSLAESFGEHTINEIGTQIGWQATALILLARDSAGPKSVANAAHDASPGKCWYCGGKIYTERGFFKCEAQCSQTTPAGATGSAVKGFPGNILDFTAAISETFAGELEELGR